MLNELSNFMNGKNPQFVYNMLIQSNPQFASFVNQNRGKTIEQIAGEYGIDFNTIKSYI